MTLNTHRNQCPYQSINFLYLMVSEIMHGQDFKGRGHYGRVESQIQVTPSCCTPTPQTNAPTKYRLPAPFGFQNIAWTRF